MRIVICVLLLLVVGCSNPPQRSFQTGVDPNYLLELERSGTTYAGGDPLKTLRKSGVDSARIRLWTNDDGPTGLHYATNTAQRAQRAGLRPYLAIFLSENWADMVKQPVPAIWKNLNDADKSAAIEAYAERVTRHFKDSGVDIDLYEIGNEIDFGLCGVFEEEWPKRVSVEYMRQNVWSKIAPMIRAAQSGVRKVKPDAKFILHLARWNEADYAIAFWKFMLDNGVSVDFPGLSYFPTSAAKPEGRGLAYVSDQVNKISDALDGRKIILCETAFPTSSNFTGQFADWNKPVPGYALNEADQKRWLADLLAMTRSHPHIAGVYYWSPEWNVAGGMWEAFALFDPTGKPRPAIESFGKSLPATPPATQPATQPIAVIQPETTNVYLGNLHAHTQYSDGTGTPREAFAYARDFAKIDFLAITEHNHLIGGEKATHDQRVALYTGPGSEALMPAADEFNADGKFVAIGGQEFSSMSKGNHVNIFDVRPVIEVPNGSFDQLLTWMQQNPDSTKQSPVLQFNHPGLGRPGKTIDANEYGRDDFGGDDAWVQRMGAVTSLIELLNGEPEASAPNRSPQIMEHHYQLYLRLGFKLAPTGNQDNHKKRWGDINDTRTGIWADTLTRESILNAMRARHVYASEDRNLKFVARMNGRLFGDVLTSAGDVVCMIDDPDEPDALYNIELFTGRVGKDQPLATPIRAFPVQGNTPGRVAVKLGRVDSAEKGDYFFLKITQTSAQGTDRAWTAPVWIEN